MNSHENEFVVFFVAVLISWEDSFDLVGLMRSCAGRLQKYYYFVFAQNPTSVRIFRKTTPKILR
jgi:hypothetical protein